MRVCVDKTRYDEPTRWKALDDALAAELNRLFAPEFYDSTRVQILGVILFQKGDAALFIDAQHCLLE